MAVDYGEDFLQRIVGVQWRTPVITGLPVRILKTSGLASGPLDLSRVIISIWFRVSSTVVDAAIADAAVRVPLLNEGQDLDAVFVGAIPLLSWGQPSQFLRYADAGGSPVTYSHTGNPSFLGLQVDPNGNFPEPYLILRFNANPGMVGGFQHSVTSPTGMGTNFPEYFQIGIPAADYLNYGRDYYAGAMTVTPDVWHHLFVSYDVSNGTAGECWIAIDRVDYSSGLGTASYFWPSGGGASGSGINDPGPFPPNKIKAGFAMFIGMNDVNGLPVTTSPGFSLDPGPAFGIPTPVAINVHASTIDVAELQIFTGITSSAAPKALEALVTDRGTPKDPVLAQAFFGKKPTVLLHPAENWVAGKNTGGTTDSTSAKFTRFGDKAKGIAPLMPDPQIGK